MFQKFLIILICNILIIEQSFAISVSEILNYVYTPFNPDLISKPEDGDDECFGTYVEEPWWEGKQNVDVSFMIISDIHFDDDKEMSESIKRNNYAIKAMNKFVTQYGTEYNIKPNEIRGVFINGDLTSNGRSSLDADWQSKGTDRDEYGNFTKRYGLCGNKDLQYPLYEGIGNHDTGPNGEAHLFPAVKDGVKRRNNRRTMITNLSNNKAHYTITWDGIRFNQLNLKPSDDRIKADNLSDLDEFGYSVAYLQHIKQKYYDGEGALTFLKQDVERGKEINGKYQPFWVMAHVPLSFNKETATFWESQEEIDKFINYIKTESISPYFLAYTHGHLHGTPTYNVSNTGSANIFNGTVAGLDGDPNAGESFTVVQIKNQRIYLISCSYNLTGNLSCYKSNSFPNSSIPTYMPFEDKLAPENIDKVDIFDSVKIFKDKNGNLFRREASTGEYKALDLQGKNVLDFVIGADRKLYFIDKNSGHVFSYENNGTISDLGAIPCITDQSCSLDDFQIKSSKSLISLFDPKSKNLYTVKDGALSKSELDTRNIEKFASDRSSDALMYVTTDGKLFVNNKLVDIPLPNSTSETKPKLLDIVTDEKGNPVLLYQIDGKSYVLRYDKKTGQFSEVPRTSNINVKSIAFDQEGEMVLVDDEGRVGLFNDIKHTRFFHCREFSDDEGKANCAIQMAASLSSEKLDPQMHTFTDDIGTKKNILVLYIIYLAGLLLTTVLNIGAPLCNAISYINMLPSVLFALLAELYTDKKYKDDVEEIAKKFAEKMKSNPNSVQWIAFDGLLDLYDALVKALELKLTFWALATANFYAVMLQAIAEIGLPTSTCGVLTFFFPLSGLVNILSAVGRAAFAGAIAGVSTALTDSINDYLKEAKSQRKTVEKMKNMMRELYRNDKNDELSFYYFDKFFNEAKGKLIQSMNRLEHLLFPQSIFAIAGQGGLCGMFNQNGDCLSSFPDNLSLGVTSDTPVKVKSALDEVSKLTQTLMKSDFKNEDLDKNKISDYLSKIKEETIYQTNNFIDAYKNNPDQFKDKIKDIPEHLLNYGAEFPVEKILASYISQNSITDPLNNSQMVKMSCDPHNQSLNDILKTGFQKLNVTPPQMLANKDSVPSHKKIQRGMDLQRRNKDLLGFLPDVGPKTRDIFNKNLGLIHFDGKFKNIRSFDDLLNFYNNGWQDPDQNIRNNKSYEKGALHSLSADQKKEVMDEMSSNYLKSYIDSNNSSSINKKSASIWEIISSTYMKKYLETIN